MEQKPEYMVEAMDLLAGTLEPRQVIQEISGFVPVFDVLLKKYQDPLTALVFGRRWQYCRMSDGVCRASLDTLADDLGISKATVMRHTEKLVEDGFLIDLTPDIRNVPHVYADAGLIVMKSQFSASVSQGNATVSQRNATVSQRNKSVSESQLIKQYKQPKRQAIKRATPSAPATPKASELPHTKLYRETTKKYPPEAVWEVVLGHVQQIEKRLGHYPTPADLKPYYQAWVSNGWNQFSVNWLEYAARGVLPAPKKAGMADALPKAFDAVKTWLEGTVESEVVNG